MKEHKDSAVQQYFKVKDKHQETPVEANPQKQMLNIIDITGKQTTYFQTTGQRPVYDRCKGHTLSQDQVNLEKGTIMMK